MTNESPLRKQLMIIRLWVWGAMHSPMFSKCRIQLIRRPVSLGIHWSEWMDELLVLRLSIQRPRIWIVVPWQMIEEFIKAMKAQGEIVEYSNFDNIH